MAPFNSHFLVAEKIWPSVKSLLSWSAECGPIHYGQFCFGCVAPDVDKVSATLTQRETHFFDRSGPRELMKSHRSAEFLRHQATFLGRPFCDLSPQEQAFSLGYLCHLCVDEVSKTMWGHETWIRFRDVEPGPAFAALDEMARQQIEDYEAIVRGLDSVEVLTVIPHIPRQDLIATLRGVRNFVHAGAVEGEYLALVDMFDRLTPAQRLERQQTFRATIGIARSQRHIFDFERLIRVGVARSRQRLPDLIAGRTPAPDYPKI